MEEKKVLITIKLANSILAYLQSKPYIEVARLIEQLLKVEEPPKEC